LAAGRKGQALNALRKGLKMGRNEDIVEVLQRLGVRKEPVFPFLARENAINVYAGLLLHKLKLR
ncbi:MAG: hypothetical protein GWN87_16735, partial [Desulfuromonadales bacterium]|nr:hypothetical protein [Desulfuromonadales bacterium]